MADDPNLKIPITVTADTRGVDQAARAIQNLNSLTKREQAEALASLKDQRSQAAQAAVKEIETREAVSAAAKRNAAAIRDTGKSLQEVTRAGADATRVMNGLEAASAGGVQGLLGVTQAFRGLMSLANSAKNVLLGPIGLALGAVAAGIAYLGKITKDNQAYIEKVFATAKDRAEAYQNKLADLKTASKESFESQVTDLRKLVASYADLAASQAAAKARFEDVQKVKREAQDAGLDRAEQEALAKAKTPEQRAKITAEYSAKRTKVGEGRVSADSQNEINTAKLLADSTAAALRNANASLEQFQKAAADAQANSDDATAAAIQAAKDSGVTSKAAYDARDAAKLASEYLKLKKAELDKAREEIQGLVASANSARDALSLVEEKAPIKAKTAADRAIADAAKGLSGPKGKLTAAQKKESDLASQYSLSAAGDFEKGGPASAETMRLQAALEAARAEGAAANKEMIEFAKTTTAAQKALATELAAAKKEAGSLKMVLYNGVYTSERNAKLLASQQKNNRQ